MIGVFWLSVLVVLALAVTTGIPFLFLCLFIGDKRKGKIW